MIHYCRNCTGLFDHDPVRYNIKCPFCKKTIVNWTRQQIALEEAALFIAKLAEKEAKSKKKGKKKQIEEFPSVPSSPDDNEIEEIPSVRPATKEEAKRARSEFYEPPDIVWEDESGPAESTWDNQEDQGNNTDWYLDESDTNLIRTSSELPFPVDEDGLPIGDGDNFIGEDYAPFWYGADGDFIEDDSSRFWEGDDGDFDEDPDEFFSGDFDSQVPFSRKPVKQEIKPWRKNSPSGKKRRTA